MSLVIVLRAFPYSSNGLSSKVLEPGAEPVDINEAVVDGLAAEGYVRRVGARPVETPPALVEQAKAAASVAEAASQEVPPFAEGGEPTGKTVTTGVEIPPDWKALKFFSLKALAKSISGAEVKDAREAAEIIQAELARRAAAQEPKEDAGETA